LGHTVQCEKVHRSIDYQIYSYMKITDLDVKYSLLFIVKYFMLFIYNAVVIDVSPLFIFNIKT